MRLVNLVIIIVSMLGSLSLLIWHRKTTIEEREKRLILEEQERQCARISGF